MAAFQYQSYPPTTSVCHLSKTKFRVRVARSFKHQVGLKLPFGIKRTVMSRSQVFPQANPSKGASYRYMALATRRPRTLYWKFMVYGTPMGLGATAVAAFSHNRHSTMECAFRSIAAQSPRLDNNSSAILPTQSKVLISGAMASSLYQKALSRVASTPFTGSGTGPRSLVLPAFPTGNRRSTPLAPMY